MPELRCQECGKSLLPSSSDKEAGFCLCTNCGREVYPQKEVDVTVKCPSCHKANRTKAIL